MSDNLLEEAKGRPRCIAILLCNEIIEDKQTNNKTLVSLFNMIACPQIPAVHPRLCVFTSFAHGRGKWPVQVSFSSPSGKEIFRMQGDLEFNPEHDYQDVVLEVRGIGLNEAGKYRIDVLVDGRVDAERIFSVHAMNPGS